MSLPPHVRDAYALTSKEDIRSLYRDWAQTYDAGFGEAQGYDLPRQVALAFVGAGGEGPVMDVGVGTGLVGDHLSALNVGPIDGLDLSAEMLAVASVKQIYRDLIEDDLMSPSQPYGGYAGFVSAGTFTFGHLGPDGIDPLLGMASPGALFVLSVNAGHFEAAGFAGKLAALGDRITDLQLRDVRIYDDRADADHRDDMARLLIFRMR